MCLAPFQHKHVRKHGTLTTLLLPTPIQLVARPLDEMRLKFVLVATTHLIRLEDVNLKGS
jgi:hypothetical protein